MCYTVVMAEDKRIARTKTELRNAVLSLIRSEAFEKISVKKICQTANVSRLTFYAYYHDKYELVEDIFRDFRERVLDDSRRRDAINNPEGDLVKTSCNLLSAIIDCFYNNDPLIRAVNYESNPYVTFAFHIFVQNCAEHLIGDMLQNRDVRFPLKPSVAFVCNGLNAFLGEMYRANAPKEVVREKMTELITRLLTEDIFFDIRN